MGAWAYCQHCGRPGEGHAIGPPTTEEILQGYIVCDNCGGKREIDEDYKTQLLLGMHEDIEKLKATVETLTKAVKLMARGALTPKTGPKAPQVSTTNKER